MFVLSHFQNFGLISESKQQSI